MNDTNIYQPIIFVIGSSGSGKSTSLRNLDPATTKIIDVECKNLPFRNASNLNVSYINNINDYDQAVTSAITDTKNKLVVIESFTKYTEMALKVAQLMYKDDGYKVYASIEKQQLAFFDKIKNKNCIVVVTGIDEIVNISQTEGDVVVDKSKRRMAVKGRAMEGRVEKEALLVLFTEVVKKDGKMEYYFQTNTDGVTSAKTPMGMFSEQLIPNDLNVVIKKVEEYYK